ncbi:MAG: lamin tail domain-containing protein [Acidobacteria bacterium]|nr:lamin tail domain-containing protein [Acidobacteriota bacterium]
MKIRADSFITKLVVLFLFLTSYPYRSESVGQDTTVPLIINELLARVPSDNPDTAEIEGDANGDSQRDASLDEFVELVNVGKEPLDVSGFEVDDGGTMGSFIFPMRTIIPPGEAVVIFGGGDLTKSRLEFANARALDLVFAVGGGAGLGFSDSGDAVVVRDRMGREVARFDYDGEMPVPQLVFQSFNRNPDMRGPFRNHSEIEGAGGRLLSPGTWVDGRAFRRTVTNLMPASGPLEGGNEVVVNGAGFGSEISSVTFGDQAASGLSRISPLELSVVAPGGGEAGPVDVVIKDQFGEIVARSAYRFREGY